MLSALFMIKVRVRARAKLDHDVTLMRVHRYGGTTSEDASREQQRIGH